MAEIKTDRTSFLGLLALMLASADTQGWAYPYWNIQQIDAALNGLANASRDGIVPLVAPTVAPTLELVISGGQLAAGQTIEIAQTFIDAYGRETDAGALGIISTGVGLTDPVAAATLGTPSPEGSGFEGGLLEVWYAWTDDTGGETLAAPVVQTDLPYLTTGLYNQILVTLPSTPAVAGATGANIYIRHRGGNLVLASRIYVDTEDSILLDGVVSDCYRSTPLTNSTGSTRLINITGQGGVSGAIKTRFYVRLTGQTWTDGDRRLLVGGLDEWTLPVTYPLAYTGLYGELASGWPPTISQVKAIRPTDLETETIGTLPAGLLPDEAVLEAELLKATGEAVLSGFVVTAQGAPDMTVHVAVGEAVLATGRFILTAIDLTIPTAPVADHRVDLICLMDDGVLEGPTENAALKGAASGAPVVPDTPAGALCLAQILVEDGVTTIVGGKITDERWVVPTLVAAVLEYRGIASDLVDHAADLVLHASKAGVIADVETSCAGLSSVNFELTAPGSMLITQVRSVVTSVGTTDYKLQLFSNEARSVLEYQAGEDVGSGIDASPFEDRIPLEWFGSTTIYGTLTNNSADELSAIAIGIKYRL